MNLWKLFIKVFNYLHYLFRNPPQIFWIFFSSRIKKIFIYALFYSFIKTYSITLCVCVDKLPVSSFSSFLFFRLRWIIFLDVSSDTLNLFHIYNCLCCHLIQKLSHGTTAGSLILLQVYIVHKYQSVLFRYKTHFVSIYSEQCLRKKWWRPRKCFIVSS